MSRTRGTPGPARIRNDDRTYPGRQRVAVSMSGGREQDWSADPLSKVRFHDPPRRGNGRSCA